MKIATATIAAIATLPVAFGCSRVLENKYDTIVSARSMDWAHTFYDYLLIHPKGQEMNGGWESNNVKWKSKYGSVVSSIVGYMEYSGLGPGQVCEGMDIDVDGASDGLNEKGLGAHLLYLGEEDGTQYAVPSSDSDVNLNYLRLVRYILDNFATVQESVDALKKVRLVGAGPNGICFGEGRDIGVHVAIQDATGDSAVIEHVGGEMQIYHGRDVVVMANEPSMDKQMELLKKFQPWGGDIVLPKGLPGSVASEDRFVRLNYYLQYTPKPTTEAMAIAIVKSLIASTNVPFGAPYQGGVYPTWWESILDSTNLVYYFGWLETPNIIWTEFAKINEIGALEEGQPNLRLKPQDPALVGDVVCNFKTKGGESPKGCAKSTVNTDKQESTRPKADKDKSLRGVEVADE